ncbi:hypothetical protein HN51_057640 [Arachis hypogaea]
MEWWVSMPKVELHAHLNGSIRDSTLLELTKALDNVYVNLSQDNLERANGQIFNVGNPDNEVSVKELVELMIQVATIAWLEADSVCGSHSVAIPLVLVLPYLFRLNQCLRQYKDTGEKTCLLNGGGGSDYKPFVQHVGIPSIDIAFGGGDSKARYRREEDGSVTHSGAVVPRFVRYQSHFASFCNIGKNDWL